VEVNEPGAEVFVDGERAEVTWAKGMKNATVVVKPGERQVEIRKEGFSVAAKRLTFKDGRHHIFEAMLEPEQEKAGATPTQVGQSAGSKGDIAARPSVRAGQERDDNCVAIKLVWCPPGEFLMGMSPAPRGRNSNEKQVSVTLTEGFWLGKTEVTQREWEQVMRTSPWQRRKGEIKDDPGCPATFVSWSDALAFCRRLNELERQAGRLPEGWEYTLPTEAQWEYACRAGTTTRYSFGEDDAEFGNYGWFAANARNVGEPFAHPVGLKAPNPWGLFDMHGNVWEWCRDVMVDELPGGINPEVIVREVAGDGARRVIRGGSWWNGPRGCRSAERNSYPRGDGQNSLGFRLALSRSAGQK
jgi:formylglycine-generating enzyme required for sulfatase activity